MTRAATILCLIAAVVCAAGSGARATAASGQSVETDRIGVASAVGLPLGLEWPAGDASSQVLGAVAADIDADGDLDVVANQGSIDLAVWINDGTGRLTRASAAPAGGPHALSTSPGVADPLRDGTTSASTAVPATDFAPASSFGPLAGGGAPLGPPPAPVRANLFACRASRAPPLDLLS